MYVYPNEEAITDQYYGLYPVDFIFEYILEQGFEWFRTTPDAKDYVFGNLCKSILSARYGQSKIDEIATYINNTEIKIIQSFPLESETSPTISINLSSGSELLQYSGLNDFEGQVDTLDGDENVTDRKEIGYTSIQDEILIGIHAVGGPDLTKYLYMLVIYLLNAYRDQLGSEGLKNITYSATDLSRLNEYLPSHMFSRFVTATVQTFALFQKDKVPMVGKIDLDVQFE